MSPRPVLIPLEEDFMYSFHPVEDPETEIYSVFGDVNTLPAHRPQHKIKVYTPPPSSAVEEDDEEVQALVQVVSQSDEECLLKRRVSFPSDNTDDEAACEPPTKKARVVEDDKRELRNQLWRQSLKRSIFQNRTAASSA